MYNDNFSHDMNQIPQLIVHKNCDMGIYYLPVSITVFCILNSMALLFPENQ